MGTSLLADVCAAMRRLVPPGVVCSAGPIAADYPPLAPAELAATGQMRSTRLQEFSAGRAHARKVLRELGLPSPTIPVSADRAPEWPPGFVGSISHAGDLVVVVAAPGTVLPAIGVDLEPCVPLDIELLNRVCRPEEVARIRSSPAALHRAKLVFSAKESVYKCVAPLTGVFLEFADVEILFGPDGDGFYAHGHGPAEALITSETVRGRFVAVGGYWLTVAWQWPHVRPEVRSEPRPAPGGTQG